MKLQLGTSPKGGGEVPGTVRVNLIERFRQEAVVEGGGREVAQGCKSPEQLG